MNILFISFDADPPYMGGTATVVSVLAKAFMAEGHFCALGYMDESKHPSVFFKHKVKLVNNNREEAESFFNKFKFDIVYNTQAMNTDFNLLKSLKTSDCKIVSAYHNRPQLRYLPFESLMDLYYESDNFFYKLYTLCKIPLLPMWKYKSQQRQRIEFQKMVDNSDKTQVLSTNFIPVLLKIVPKTNPDKIVAIENPIVFDTVFPIAKLPQKQKRVLVVCSVNYQKRAYLMIKIWAQLERDKALDDWSFDFVGGGIGFERLKKLAKNLKIRRINFLSYQSPEIYYERSSIFMMTSRFEGWPMVLMESMQMGVVPVVYNSFESLPDIIEDGVNGFIIPNNDFDFFVKKMKYLMLNDENRHVMARKAIAICSRFTPEIISKKYLNLFNSI
jgi:glycosyltransferase involved in cell wall biosynthesis